VSWVTFLLEIFRHWVYLIICCSIQHPLFFIQCETSNSHLEQQSPFSKNFFHRQTIALSLMCSTRHITEFGWFQHKAEVDWTLCQIINSDTTIESREGYERSSTLIKNNHTSELDITFLPKTLRYWVYSL
jgi:hypothetical protein